MAIPLFKFFSLSQAYNIILTFAFVFAGVSAFWLAYYLTKNYLSSLIAGYIYTFSEFHFAHAEGHLQTVSMQWIPLFILLWMKFLGKPNIILAVASAVFLYFNLLSDYYYFFYCVVISVILYLWQAKRSQNLLLGGGKKFILAAFTFLVIFVLTSGKIIAALILQNLNDPLLGSHPASMFSTDLFSVFIPGGHFRFADLTYNFWSKLPGNIHESSVYLGISVITMMIYVWGVRKKLKEQNLSVWFVIFSFFLVLSFGPSLQIMGEKVSSFVMPYLLLEKVFPIISLSGMPVRMMAVVFLSSGIIFAFGIKKLVSRGVGSKVICLIFLTVLFFEYLPRQIPQTKISVPSYIQALEVLPHGGVLDTTSSPTEALYYQTVHTKPLALGYIARTPASVALSDLLLTDVYDSGNFNVLCKEYGIRYFIVRAEIKIEECEPNIMK